LLKSVPTLDRCRYDGEDQRVSRLLRALAATASVALLTAGCSGGGASSAADDHPASVAAYPETPHFEGRLAVTLQPALPVVGDPSCAPDPDAHQVCSPDGREAYRVLGSTGAATVIEVSVAPSADHTSWVADVRFDPASRTAVGAARDAAAGLGGLVLVCVADRVLLAVRPADLRPAVAHYFGLEKPEAWAIADRFSGV
jgi:hypothetical protein